MSRLALVTGGARSGKSAFAERLAAGLAAAGLAAAGSATADPVERPVTYVATAIVTDAEMRERIVHHRTRRPGAWRTIEAPLALGEALREAGAGGGVVLVDCLAVWCSNRLLALGDPDADAGAARSAWRDRVTALEGTLRTDLDEGIDSALAMGADLVLVTNEVGLGLVPPTPLGRAYRDLLGRLNQHVAGRASAVHLVVAGIAVDLCQLPHSAQG